MTLKVHWYFDGGAGRAFINYRATASAVPDTAFKPARKVRGFLPSTSGLHFINSFKKTNVSIPVGATRVPVRGNCSHRVRRPWWDFSVTTIPWRRRRGHRSAMSNKYACCNRAMSYAQPTAVLLAQIMCLAPIRFCKLSDLDA